MVAVALFSGYTLRALRMEPVSVYVSQRADCLRSIAGETVIFNCMGMAPDANRLRSRS